MKYQSLKWIGTLGCLLAATLLLAPVVHADSAAEDLRLTVGKSVVIDYASDIRQISTSNPEIADASPVTTREVILHGKSLGTATLIVWNREGQRYFYNINVEMSLDALRKLIKETFPTEQIQVQSSRESVSLTGVVSNPLIAERAGAMAASFAKTVINNIVVNTGVAQQIVLRVKFAELSRTAASQFGVNILSGAFGQSTSTTTGQFGSVSVGGTVGGALQPSFTISQALNIFAFRRDLNLGAYIQALQSKGIVQILAEPNLVTSNGKEASFLVGGEAPVPVLQGGANASSVTVQFKEFGIRLRFTPTVTMNKTIKLDLSQEVSAIDAAHGVAFNGFVIPAFSTRRASTSIELAEHQSFLVAGLLDNRDTESFSKLPGISQIPVLGQLFKSRDISKGQDELVMVVTPEITQPYGADDVKPMPDFPNEFLVPVQPITPQATRAAATAAAAKQAKADKADKTKTKKAVASSRKSDQARAKPKESDASMVIPTRKDTAAKGIDPAPAKGDAAN